MDDVADEEELLRHIPSGTLWQAPGPRITSANFQLRHDRGETGVSVTRAKLTTADQLLKRLAKSFQQGSRVASALVKRVRDLGLVVVPKPTDDDPGHAEIQSGTSSLDEHGCRKKLAMLFQLLPAQD